MAPNSLAGPNLGRKEIIAAVVWHRLVLCHHCYAPLTLGEGAPLLAAGLCKSFTAMLCWKYCSAMGSNDDEAGWSLQRGHTRGEVATATMANPLGSSQIDSRVCGSSSI